MSIHLCTWKCVSTKAHLFPSKTSPIRRIFILFLCRETKTVLCRKCWATAWSLTANWTYHCDAELKMTISRPRWFPSASVQTSLQLQVVVHSFLWNWFQWLSLGNLFEPAKFYLFDDCRCKVPKELIKSFNPLTYIFSSSSTRTKESRNIRWINCRDVLPC